MRKEGVRLVYSPSDLVNFVRSEFITWMDRYYLEQQSAPQPDADTEEQDIIQEKGVEHERAFLESLVARSKAICDLHEFPAQTGPTLDAMRRGEEVIYQGYLADGDFAGYPDFLIRVKSQSAFGDWAYEPWDTKLARHVKPYFLVQLCCYAEMLESAQDVRPRSLGVVLGGPKGAKPEVTAFRTDDFFFYYRSLRASFLDQQRSFDATNFPDIPPLADLGRWTGFAERKLEARDDLALVADIRLSQIHKLRAAGITTMTELAGSNEPTVPQLHDDTLAKLQKQARLQVASRGESTPRFEILQPVQSNGPQGLLTLPAASPADVFSIWRDSR